MRNELRNKRKGIFNEINVIPYVDVSLVLLLVFMISAPLIQQGVDIDLPKANAKDIRAIEEEPMVISINNQAQLFFNYADKPSAPIKPSRLLVQVVALNKVQPNLPVLVKGDNSTRYGHIVQVMALLQQAGIPKVGLMTDPKE